MATLSVTQKKSTIGATQRQRATIASLGLRRMHHTVEHADTPEIRGMIARVSHLVSVTEAGGGRSQQ